LQTLSTKNHRFTTSLVLKKLLLMMKLKKPIVNLHFVCIQIRTEHQQHRTHSRKLVKHINVYLMHKKENIMICLAVSKGSRHNSIHKTLTLTRYSDKCFKDKGSTICLDRLSLAKEWVEGKVDEVVKIL